MFGALMFATCYFLFDEVGAILLELYWLFLEYCITNKHIGEVLAPVGRILRSQFEVVQGDYKDWRSKRAEQTEKKNNKKYTADVLQNKKKLLNQWKKSKLIRRLFQISLRIIL